LFGTGALSVGSGVVGGSYGYLPTYSAGVYNAGVYNAGVYNAGVYNAGVYNTTAGVYNTGSFIRPTRLIVRPPIVEKVVRPVFMPVQRAYYSYY